MVLILFCLVVGTTACVMPATVTKEQPVPDKGAYSVFIYVCGSDLETKHGAATKNIQELLNAGAGGEGVNIVLQTGGTRKWRGFDISSTSIQRYVIQDGSLILIESLPNASMGNADTLADFLSFGIESFPAEKYAAIIWNHGGGSLGGIAFDEQHSYDALKLGELGEAFEKAFGSTNEEFELIGLDACLMATLETAQTLAPFGNYLVASQEILPTTGWDYAAIATNLYNEPDQTGDKLGMVICDSYYEKCDREGKEQAVTLSVIDLDKISALSDHFSAFSEAMKEDIDELYYIAQCIEDSPAYGGATKHEGHSNLFDLGCFADNMAAVDLSAALNEAVVYQRTGRQRAEATGLSFYYPQTFSQNETKQYMEAFPDSKYAAFLNAAFSDVQMGTVKFLDTGSAADNGGFSVRLSQSSLKFVSTVEFELIQGDGEGESIRLGLDNNMYDNWEEGLFTSDFQGYWIALGGYMLQCHPVDETADSFIFSAPILLNSEPANLRFAFVVDQRSDNAYDGAKGHYEILGAWSGIDQITGMSRADMRPLKAGDEITILYEASSGEPKPGETVIYQNDSVIYDKPLSEGLYQYQYIVTDIFGNTYQSDTAIFEVSRGNDNKPNTQLQRIKKTQEN